MKYTGILLAADGDYVTDCKGETTEEVSEQLANLGSRWYFYPFQAIIRNDVPTKLSKRRLVETAFPIEFLRYRTVGNASHAIEHNKENWERGEYDKVSTLASIRREKCQTK